MHVESRNAAGDRIDRHREAVFVALLAALAATAALVATRHGIALSPDSVSYLSAARNLAAGRGYLDFTGAPDTTFPPLFPAAVAAGNLLGWSLTTSARLVNAGSFAAIVVLSWRVLRRHVDATVVRLGALTAIASSPVLLDVSAKAWSEPLFCVFLLAFVLVLERATSSLDARLRLAAAAGLLAGTSVLVRYVGVSLIVTGVAVCALVPLRNSVRRRAARSATFLAAAIPVPALWLARNALSGAPHVLGPRVALSASPWVVVREFVLATAGMGAVPTAQLIFLLCAVPVVALVVGGALRASRRLRTGDDRSGLSGRAASLTLVAFVVVYAAMLLVAGQMSGASVDGRTVMPLFVPLVVLVARFADDGRNAWEARAGAGPRGRFAAPAVRGSAAACLVITVFVFATTAWDDGRTARGYGSAAVAHPATVAAAVRSLDNDALVVTNHPWTLYTATAHQPVLPTPGPLYPSVSIAPATFAQIASAACSEPVYLAWFTRGPNAAQPPNLGTAVEVSTLRSQVDGTLYEVRPSTRDHCTPHVS